MCTSALITLLCVVARCVRPSWLLLSLCERIGGKATCPTRTARPRRDQAPSARTRRGDPLPGLAGSQVRPPELGPLSSRVPREQGGPVSAPPKEAHSGCPELADKRGTLCLRGAAILIARWRGPALPPTFADELWLTTTRRELTRLRRFGELKGGRPWSHPPRRRTCSIRLRETRWGARALSLLVATRGAIGPQHSTLLPLTLGPPNSLPPQRPLPIAMHPKTLKRRGAGSEATRHSVGAALEFILACQSGSAGCP